MSNFTRPSLPTRENIFLKRFLSMIFLAPATILLSAWSFQDGEEKVTIKGNDVPLITVFKTIKKQAGYNFFYAADYVNDKEKVSVDVKNAKVEDVLQKVLGKDYVWVYNENAVSITKKKEEVRRSNHMLTADSSVTQITVSGLVTDAKGAPVPGATVIVKGTKEGASTDENGRFSLPGVAANAILVISSVGFEPREISVKGKTILAQLNVSINDLDEAVVVAYNTTTQRANTGAMTTVKGEQIRSLPNRSFDKSLQGLVPGLLVTSRNGQPGSGVSNFVLRGIATAIPPSSHNGTQSVRNPLIVIDGMPVSQDLSQVSSNNQTTLSIIGNEVNPLAQLNPSDIETITVLKDAAAVSLYGARASNGVILITTKRGKAGKTVFSFRHQTDISTRLKSKVEVLNQQEYLDLLYQDYKSHDPSLTDADIAADLKSKFPTQPGGEFYQAPDWYRELFVDKALTFSNDLSMSGGNEKTNFYLNLEYTKQKGIVKKTGFDRKSLRFNFENRPASWLKLGLNSTFSYNIQDYLGEGRDLFLPTYISPLNTIRLLDGSYDLYYDWGTLGAFSDANPAAIAEYNTYRNTSFRGLSKIYGEISFLKYFKVTANLGVDFMLNEAREKNDPRLPLGSDFPVGNGKMEERDSRSANVVTTNILRFDKVFSNDHVVGAVLGQEAQVLTQKELFLQVTGLKLPYYDQLSSPGTRVSSGGGLRRKETLLSLFGQVNYGYKDKYFFTGSLRRDGSSRFGDDRRFGTYWSTGIGWVITAEPFMKRATASWLDYLKVRGSIGAAGNASAINAFTRFDQLAEGTFLGGIFVHPTYSPANADIQWEQTFTSDAGLEARFLKERISVTADIYKRNTSNLVYLINLPQSSGYSNVLSNIGEMENKGVEISLAADIIRNKDFRWNLNVNWSTNKNKLVKSSVPDATFDSGESESANQEGMNFNSFYLVRWAGVDPADGAPQWLDADGKITKTFDADDRVFVGKPQPDGFGAITSTFGFKGIELSAMFYYQYGYQLYDQSSTTLLSDGNIPFINQSNQALNRWRKPGDIAPNPRRSLNNTDGGNAPSTRYLFDGDYVRLQNVILSYRFPQRILDQLHLSMLRVFIQGNNLALWTKYPGADPINVSPFGRSEFVYPSQKTISAGLNISF